MSKNITDITNWEKEYPFLNEVWEFHNKLNILMDKDEYNGKIFSMCHMILRDFGKDTGEYDSFCLKLLHNLGHYSDDEKSFIRSHDRCNILYNWIYNLKEKHKIPDEIINKCFDEYITISKVMKYMDACSYNSHNTFYEDPMNVTLLNIFESSIGTIINILNGEKSVINIPCRKFVCKNVQIYNDMYQKWCVNAREGNQRHENTCSKLKQFKYSYTHYFRSKLDNEAEIPSLDDIQNNYFTECQKYLQEQVLDTTLVTQDQPKYSSRNLPEGEKQSSPMSSTVSTTIGTMAGASSILALLYKFTSGRRWIHSGFGRQSGRINNDLYAEGLNELSFDGFQGEDMSSYNARYNIGYGSA
ncbi:Plasmodium vivax Vir protein, putative [Plasmodium vivax]|uniref:Vir protein, putative n=1 Tax=Plasmodium vivax TaxID=5855 RepID=A0A1G4HDL6_PLAVI|nr:Plasmodium vivax Vir protein, putative [Plasmodium vivax]